MKTVIKNIAQLILLGILFSIISCSSIPKNATAVQDFEIEKYLGTWYEIARIDFKHEEGLNNVSAQYSDDSKGNVLVKNSGYDYEKNEWTVANGWAKFKRDKNVAELKVSFFRPFYSGYNVVALDDEYKYALVAGKNLDYLWILSRTKEIPENIKQEYLNKAKQIGYDTSRLIWVKHDRDDNPYMN